MKELGEDVSDIDALGMEQRFGVSIVGGGGCVRLLQ